MILLDVAISAITLGDMSTALEAVQKMQPHELQKIIQFALTFENDVAKAVIALAQAMLIIAQLEAKLEAKAAEEQEPVAEDVLPATDNNQFPVSPPTGLGKPGGN